MPLPKRKAAKPQTKPERDYEQLGRMLTNIYETGYIDRNQMYKMSFAKGVLAGLGGVIGATIVVAALLWLLSFLENVPLLDAVVNNIQNTVESAEN